MSKNEEGAIGNYINALKDDKKKTTEKISLLKKFCFEMETYLNDTDDFYNKNVTGDTLGDKLSTLRSALSLGLIPLVDKETTIRKSDTPHKNKSLPGGTIININKDGDEEKAVTQVPVQPRGLVGAVSEYLATKTIDKNRVYPLDTQILFTGIVLQKTLSKVRNQHIIYGDTYLYFKNQTSTHLKSRLLKDEIKLFLDALLPYAEACSYYLDGKFNDASARIAEAQATAQKSVYAPTLGEGYSRDGFSMTPKGFNKNQHDS